MSRRPRPRACALAVLTVLHTSCSAWHRRDVPAPAPATAGDSAASAALARRVRVTRADGSRVVLAGARVAGDSLVGEAGRPGRRLAVALANVRRVDERRVSRARTIGLVAGIAAVVVAATIAIAVSTLDFGGNFSFN